MDYLAQLYNVRPFDGCPDEERVLSEDEVQDMILLAQVTFPDVQVRNWDNGDIEVFNSDGGILFLLLPDEIA